MTEFVPEYGELEYIQSPTISKLMPALLDAVAEFDPMLKDATNPAFKRKYASLSSLLNAVVPSLLKHRLLQTGQTSIDVASGKNIVITRIIHESGEWIAARWLLTPAKPDPQGEGSALTYARRYTLTALLGIAAEDDDANAASNGAASNGRAHQQPAAPAVEPSGRDWLAEASELCGKTRIAPLKRREALLLMLEECRAFNELTNDIYVRFVELGNALKAEADVLAAVAS